ncbi:hypothetical protein [Intrasporangium flavum]|uniref:hypothetical protein n=1 Tax=Intrasporangium flavum TaxID=1428657 RepID=UPI001F617C5C|nr:hypothetical protein [Intrasporangium flavum]
MTGVPDVTDRIALAALNNALWCDAVARSHGVTTSTDADAWTAATRTPPYYPDAVTLSPTVGEYNVLARVDDSDGCSVKDSWNRLDLSLEDFARIVVGQWVWLDPATPVTAPTGPVWRRVDSAAGMAAWVRAWATDPEAEAILRPSLLDEPGVHVLAAHASTASDARVVAGAVVNVTGKGPDAVAGLSNVFARAGDEAATWAAAAAAGRDVVGALPLVGWEAGPGVEAATAAGCELLGPLSVWLK